MTVLRQFWQRINHLRRTKSWSTSFLFFPSQLLCATIEASIFFRLEMIAGMVPVNVSVPGCWTIQIIIVEPILLSNTNIVVQG